MPIKVIRIATRKSNLALYQAEYVKRALLQCHQHIKVTLVPMVTQGDKLLNESLVKAGGKGLFVKELEHALLNRQADIAVHSMKDVPMTLPPGLGLPVICARESAFDVFVSQTYRDLASLPIAACLGTSSSRRASQLLAQRADLQIKLLRGNVETRLAKLVRGDYDAIILAQAGLQRLQLTEYVQQTFDCQMMVPAAGQGALGIECRQDDEEIVSLIAALDDPVSHQCVQAERQVVRELGGDCHAPIGVYARVDKQLMKLTAMVGQADGQRLLRVDKQAPVEDADILTRECVDELLTLGARELLEDARQ